MKKWRRFLIDYGVLVAFIVLFIASAASDPKHTFVSAENLRNIFNQNVSVGIVAIGMTLVIITGGIDLSVGSLLALSGALGIMFLNKQMAGGSEQPAAIMGGIACVGVGALLGAFNGMLISWGRIVPFVATLVGLVGFRSLALALADGGNVQSSSYGVFPKLATEGITVPFIKVAGGTQPLVIYWGMLIFVVMALLAGLLLNKTRLGRYMIAVGSNERAAFYSGISTQKIKFLTYTLSGLFTGIAALTLSSRMNTIASGQTGQFYELDAIAAVVIGGTQLKGGRGRIWGTVVGVLLLGLITNMLVLRGISVYWQGVVKGLIILFAVLLQRE